MALRDRGDDELYRWIFEHAADAIFVADRTGRYIMANARACELVGYTLDELLQRTMVDLAPIDVPPPIASMPPTLRAERFLRRKDGVLVPVELTGVRFPDGTMLGIARDISERKQAEAALRQREQELEALADATKEALFVHQDGIILATNKAARELYRIPSDGAVGQRLFDYVAPESVHVVQQHIAAASMEPYEAIARRTDGTTFPAAVQARTATFRGKPARLAAIQDLTDLRKLQASLAFADRMASVGTLAAGVAHEINNPLTFVSIGLEAIARRLERADLPSELRADMSQILRDVQDGARRVASIVRDLKVFSRAEDGTAGAVELGPVIEYAARIAASEIKHRARLVLELGEPAWVIGNETRLGQVFLNLLINAAQAIPVGRADEHEIAVRVERAGDHVVVAVSDTGDGIDPELMPRIFEPFITTKASGTGLGLAICHGIVTRLGGTIEVAPAAPHGTVFRVSLPTTAPAAVRAPDPVKASAPAMQRGRVLIVDDEPLILQATSRVLGGECDITTASSARDALARFERGERFDAVLCDLMMPEMTGIELYETVSARWPELASCFLFLTGGVFTRQAAAFLESCSRPWLDKPFVAASLQQAVRTVVAASHAR